MPKAINCLNLENKRNNYQLNREFTVPGIIMTEYNEKELDRMQAEAEKILQESIQLRLRIDARLQRLKQLQYPKDFNLRIKSS